MRLRNFCRIFLPVLCLILFLSFPSAVRAEESNTQEAYEAIVAAYEQVLVGEVTVDLSQYGITVDQLNELVPRSNREGLQPWYLGPYSYKYNKETNIVSSVTFKLRDPDVYDYALYEQTVAEILHETVKPGMSQWQIALAIHDYLVLNCAYDETLTYHRAYDALVGRSAVCSGYAEAYMDLLRRVGIECRYVSSKDMDHAWNLVKIGDHWLHVDVTWDDPTSDRQGRVMHKYFLISDSAISDEDHKHYGWESDIQSTYTEWDTDRFWHDIESQIYFESRDLCFLREQTGKTAYTIYSRDSETGKLKKIASCDAGYIDIGGSKDHKYFYHNNGLSYDGGKLYYSDMVKVYSINPDGSGKKTVYTHNYQENKTYIAGSFVSGGVLYLTMADHDGALTAMQITLAAPSHSHSYTAEHISASCTAMGYDRLTCDCGVTYQANHTPALGHNYDGGVVIREATAERCGIRRYTCQDCGITYDMDEIYVPKVTQPSDTTPDHEDEEGVSEEEYTVRRIVLVVGILVVIRFFIRKRR